MRKLLSLLLVSLLTITSGSLYADTPTKTWTFLIYLNGNNSLDQFGANNIKDMEKVGSNDQVNVIVEWASLSAHKTVRMLIKKSTNPQEISSPIIENLGKIDMGDVETLDDFIAWGVKNYPAEHYFIDVWNHGSGWHTQSAFANNLGRAMDISWDDNTGNSISTEQLGQAMAYAAKLIGHKVDVYGSDACLMAMAEVANEMTNSVDYFLGSQETEPGAGWPYKDLLSRWEGTPNATPEQVAKILVDAYVKSYQHSDDLNRKEEVTFSAYDLNKLPAFNTAVAALGTKLLQLNPSERATVVVLATQTQRFVMHDYADLMDFVNRLAVANIHSIDTQDITDLQTTARELIIANADTKKYIKATGLSIWLPTTNTEYNVHSARYNELQFNKVTQWNNTLAFLLQGVHAQ